MRLIITGGAGFLGRRLANMLAGAGEFDEVVLVDRLEVEVSAPQRSVALDVTREGALEPLLEDGPATIVHLASVVSAGAEADWQLAMDVNVGGLVNVFASCLDSGHVHRFVFASSVAVFGDELARGVVGDAVKQTPRSTYGVTKAFGELMVDDLSRKGLIDGRTGRLPTVIVRPGEPNAAASGFASGMFREPLAGIASTVPVDPSTEMVVIGTETAVACLARLALMDGASLGSHRAVGLPGLRVSVAEMLACLERVGGQRVRGLVDVAPDPAVSSVVGGWPSRWDDRRARDLDFPADESLDAIVLAHLAAHDGPTGTA